jgi:hypothetical protein
MCALNTMPYELPCPRLSPMDLFYEARWFFDEKDRVTWYNEMIKPLLMKPRIARFGILTTTCAPPNTNVCWKLLNYRTNPLSPGYEPTVALLIDVGNLEMSDPCRICVEETYSKTITELYEGIIPSFRVLGAELSRFNQVLVEAGDTEGQTKVTDIASKVATLLETITKDDIEDFYYYYVIRGTYARMAVGLYLEGYAALEEKFKTCPAGKLFYGLTYCPPVTVNETEALVALFNHADNVFSSVTTAGSPLPIWSEGDGTGTMFMGNSPVGGSGIDMSADLLSLVEYLDITQYTSQDGSWTPLYEGGASGYIDPLTPGGNWTNLVEKNPLYA